MLGPARIRCLFYAYHQVQQKNKNNKKHTSLFKDDGIHCRNAWFLLGSVFDFTSHKMFSLHVIAKLQNNGMGPGI